MNQSLRHQPSAANVADDAYLASTRYTLHTKATGYTADSQVWQTVRTQLFTQRGPVAVLPQSSQSFAQSSSA